ncbi:MAG: hypothetical protein GY754_42880 [bacterium]|nr:hypothetical protein [bacterium]
MKIYSFRLMQSYSGTEEYDDLQQENMLTEFGSNFARELHEDQPEIFTIEKSASDENPMVTNKQYDIQFAVLSIDEFRAIEEMRKELEFYRNKKDHLH